MFTDIVLSLIQIALIGSWFSPREGSCESEANTLNGIFACLSVMIVIINFAD